MMRVRESSVVALITLLSVGMLSGPAIAADIIFSGGHVYTADPDTPRAEALVVEGGKIVYVGSSESALTYATEDT